MPNLNETDRSQKGMSRRRLLELAGVGAVVVACGPDEKVRVATATPIPTSTPTESPSPTPTPTPTPTPPETGKGATGTETNVAHSLKRFEKPGDGATLYGVDEWSKDEKNWDWAKDEEGFTIVLKDRPGNITTRVKVVPDTVFQGWIRINKVDGIPAMGFVLNPNILTKGINFMDGQGFIARRSTNSDALWHEIVPKGIAQEEIEQPGTVYLLINACPSTCPPAPAK